MACPNNDDIDEKSQCVFLDLNILPFYKLVFSGKNWLGSEKNLYYFSAKVKFIINE